MSFIQVLFVFHAQTWHGFWTSSSHGIFMAFAKKMMWFPSDLVSFSTKLRSKRREKIRVIFFTGVQVANVNVQSYKFIIVPNQSLAHQSYSSSCTPWRCLQIFLGTLRKQLREKRILTQQCTHPRRGWVLIWDSPPSSSSCHCIKLWEVRSTRITWQTDWRHCKLAH